MNKHVSGQWIPILISYSARMSGHLVHEQAEVDAMIRNILEIIWRSSLCSPSIVLVEKLDGKRRLCVDYRMWLACLTAHWHHVECGCRVTVLFLLRFGFWNMEVHFRGSRDCCSHKARHVGRANGQSFRLTWLQVFDGFGKILDENARSLRFSGVWCIRNLSDGDIDSRTLRSVNCSIASVTQITRIWVSDIGVRLYLSH